ncbi:gephyrin-like molybdotransferase Glp [Nereida sp. MMG025]|uniref:molybdopterin molybdotransferase MoeA n=1 Tax=Nereida sp. MMG025 TaxID=2909981 RepID=UPI001F3FE040|nr:gephyrin-like molybdotransferase Glp [Nereida sp. MMG025]MCF6443595.1 molybdopterin molybdotransferase MoeA [Nereida sp. MMG025]
MITVAQALDYVLALADAMPSEEVPLRQAAGRVLAQDVTTTLTQPPFASSAMDGYAVRDADWTGGATLTVIGEAAAGHSCDTPLGAGQAVRIFTGAPVPEGADRVVIQEDVTRTGDTITLGSQLDQARHIRAAGQDFKTGHTIKAPRLLAPRDIALLAAMNIAQVPVTRKPVIAILATGDELVQPGETPARDQIIASNTYGLAAMVEAAGGTARLLPIARDTAASLSLAFDLAQGADLLVTVGGASVGDHDLVGQVAQDKGLDRAFYKVAMRPGKPLMAGNIGDMAMLGLPGNPVSAMVCGEVFLRPLLNKMRGLPAGPRATRTAPTCKPIPANGPREHYMRGRLQDGQVKVFDRQDSALIKVLHAANCLIKRAPHAPDVAIGEETEIILLDNY